MNEAPKVTASLYGERNTSATGTLQHVELHGSDVKRSCEFWGWLLESLGYTLFQEWSSGRSWCLGDTYLVFVQAESQHLGAPLHRRRPELNHLAFHTQSKEHVDELTGELKYRSVRMANTLMRVVVLTLSILKIPNV